MPSQPHEINKSYNFNYLLDAANLYHTARWLELHKPLEDKDRLLDELFIRRLRTAADNIVKQSLAGMKIAYDSPNIGMELVKQLAEQHGEK